MDETRRSDRTRAAILTAARAEFAKSGFQSATVRTIAADAGVDPALVIRYFGSKEQLFQAALDIRLELPDLTAVPADRLGEQVIRHFAGKWEDETFREASIFLFRTAMTNEIAAERMRAVFREQVIPHVASLLADPAEAEQRAAAVMTQLLGLGACRYVIGVPPLVELEIDTLAARFGPTIQRYLTAELG
ncbi:TetR family transcriptional regulator [Fodinicola acaciae]|uniref:TetR/AcrR family transcriptional regulator n=1 Tax=Fodinicola acaciae TaxID=2681555 RepID=UPI0013D145ED|nr:TetR family transcriptional regulator [Fodinicola acaciae]